VLALIKSAYWWYCCCRRQSIVIKAEWLLNRWLRRMYHRNKHGGRNLASVIFQVRWYVGSGVYSMDARHALHALRFSWNFFFHRKCEMITQVWFKFLHKAHASSIFHRSANVWCYCILGTETRTCVYLKVQGACTRNLCCMHAHVNLHSGTLASNFTNVRLVAWLFVTVLGENSVNCHRQLYHH
jgi:hypothetical protein